MKIQTNQNSYNYPNKPNFEGYYRSHLGKTIDKFIKTEAPTFEQAENLLTKIVNFWETSPKTKILGGGFHGKVIKIDDKYVLKVDKVFSSCDLELPHPPKIEDDFSAIKNYYGNPVITFGRFFRILKNVSSNGEHLCAGIPSSQERHLPFYADKCAYWCEKYLPKFASLPQKSFDALAKSFAKLNKKNHQGIHYAFDTQNPNNIVLVGKNTLRIVDDVARTGTIDKNTTGGLLNLLVSNMSLDYTTPKDFLNIGLRCELIRKIILAGEKHNLPQIRSKSDIMAWQHTCEEFGNYNDIIREINKISATNSDKKVRMEKLQAFLNETFNPENIDYNHYF